MYCKECGNLYENENLLECTKCGANHIYGRKYCEKCGTINDCEKQDICTVCGNYFLNSRKTKLVSLVLLLLLGMFGAHQFYAGNKITGLMYICLTIAGIFTFGAAAVVTIILLITDLATILANNFKDKNKKVITKWR